jgi:tRNA A37 threonylcarbamoyltransferase TsaD
MKENKKSMTLEVLEGQPDVFTEDSQFAYKLGKIYKVLVSEKTYCAGSCIGHMRVIVDGNRVKQWIYPLMSGGEYELIDSTKMERYRKIVETYDSATKINIP